MRGLRLQYRILIPFFVLVLVATAATAWVTLRVSTQALQSRVRTQLVSAAGVIGRGDMALNPAILQTLSQILRAEVITFRDGEVIVSSLPPGQRGDLVAAATAVIAARPPGDAVSGVAAASCGGPCLIAYQPVVGRPGTVVALVAETTDLASATRTVTRAILVATLLSLIVMVLVGQAVVHRVTAPLDRLVRFARDVAPEGTHRRAEVGNDEAGTLAEAFNGMLDRLERAQQALVRSEKLALTGLFAARVAHDIRNPMSSIKMQTQLVQAQTRGNPDNQAMLDSMLHDIDQVESVIRDLLELARPGDLTLEPASINAIVRDALGRLRPQFAHRHIAVDTRLDDDLPPVPIDTTRFRQVLLNVFVNASEAMITEGHLTVTSRSADEGGILLEITDDGVGIDPDLGERAFDPFVTTKRDGVGLGLVNAKAVVDAHRGRIRIEPRQSRGTCVTIWLPGSST